MFGVGTSDTARNTTYRGGAALAHKPYRHTVNQLRAVVHQGPCRALRTKERGFVLEDKTKNFYHAGKFVFNIYKTKNTYNQQVVDVPEELNAILKLWIKLKPNGSEYLLINLQTNAKIKSSDMTKLLKQVFQNEHIGVSVLRNVFLSEKYSGLMEDLKKDAAQMGTSICVAENTYIKK